jgi:hypothetical protein
MVELTCDHCGEHVSVTLSVLGVTDVVVKVHPSTTCRCVDRMTHTELLDMMFDAYSAEGVS